MKRLAAALLGLTLGAIGCTSSSQEQAQEPTPSNQADGETGSGEEGGPAATAGEAAQEQPPPGPTGTTGSIDRDGDGIRDDMDRCPDEPEDRDGFEDEDGCPEADNDRDGILDVDDKCPAQPESKNGRQDEDGCPE